MVGRGIRTVNNVLRSLLFQASLPPWFWAESLHAAKYLLNQRPTKILWFSSSHRILFGVEPSYDHLCIFGCLCYPNLSSTIPHKLSPRSTPCVLLGYLSNNKGYRCFDLVTRGVFVSCHVVFDKNVFPFAKTLESYSSSDLEFLLDFSSTTTPSVTITSSPIMQTISSTTSTSRTNYSCCSTSLSYRCFYISSSSYQCHCSIYCHATNSSTSLHGYSFSH